MTEETPGFDEQQPQGQPQQPDVPSSGSEDAEPKAAPQEGAAPAWDAAAAAQVAGLTAQLDQVRTPPGERTADRQRLQAEYQNSRRR
ncbi:nucleotide exchange factor GrpE, partial [Streptomyces sp. JV178]